MRTAEIDMLRVDRTMSVRAEKQSKRAMSGRRMTEGKIERNDKVRGDPEETEKEKALVDRKLSIEKEGCC